jgi:ABC-2 type transport system ATP-binding protein
LIAIGPPETLKTTLMKEQVLEVLCEGAETAMGKIEELPSVKEAALFGKGLHLVVDDAEEAESQVRRLLSGQGCRVDRIERIMPSLEDVFVSLIEARDRDLAPQAEVQR